MFNKRINKSSRKSYVAKSMSISKVLSTGKCLSVPARIQEPLFPGDIESARSALRPKTKISPRER